MYEETERQRRMLAAAAARLFKPKLVACFSAWSSSWLESQQSSEAIEADQLKRLLAERQARCKTLSEEADQLRRDSTTQLAEVEERHRLAMEQQQLQLTTLLDNERRVQRRCVMGQRAARRLINQGLARGWEMWHALWAREARQRRMLEAACARLARPMLVACISAWRQDWAEHSLAAERQAQREAAFELHKKSLLASVEARQEAAVVRISLEEVIVDLEEEMRAYLEFINTVIPPKEPRYLVLHTISATGVPDADALGGSDPYVRFFMMTDNGRDVDRRVLPAYTSFKRKEIDPVWENERCQFKLPLGGLLPPALRIEVRCLILAYRVGHV